MLRSFLGLPAILCCLLWSLPALSSEVVREKARQVTLFFTNDIESVYEPIEAWWRDDMAAIGGMAKLSTLIQQQRRQTETSFLLDAGDIFTGSLSKATKGALAFDLYSAMAYDAVNLGNHEFEYGWQRLREVKQRARFPVLNANIYYAGTNIPFAQAYTILERDGVRVGVVGTMGIDAFLNTMMPANRQGLEIQSPLRVTQSIVDQLRPEVDLMVLLTHQNRTAPMQTDKEADLSVARGFDEDYALAGDIRGVDMIIGGHSDNGLDELVQHPQTGTWIGMTYGQGMHLGYATFELPNGQGRAVLSKGGLLTVNADELEDDPKVSGLIQSVRAAHPELTRVLGRVETPAARLYNRESDLGNLIADMLRNYAGTDVALVPPGALRADLASGEVTVEQMLNIFPFTDTVATVKLSGSELMQVLEKGASLDYGFAQLSGVTLTVDPQAPRGERVSDVFINGVPVNLAQQYTLATVSFTATGGEGYTVMAPLEKTFSERLVSDVLIDAVEEARELKVPPKGRVIIKSRDGQVTPD